MKKYNDHVMQTEKVIEKRLNTFTAQLEFESEENTAVITNMLLRIIDEQRSTYTIGELNSISVTMIERYTPGE